MHDKFEIIKYEKEGILIDIRYDSINNTIWLTQSEIASIFDTSKTNVKIRLNDMLKNIQGGKSDLPPDEILISFKGQRAKAYSLCIIEKLSLRSKSTNGLDFIKWANKLIDERKNNHELILSPNKAEIATFVDDDFTLDVTISPAEETVWLTQEEMALLFDTSKQNVSLHIINIFEEKELEKSSVVKESLTTASDGKNYNYTYYNLDVIISVGYRIKSKRGTIFRKWATNILKQYLIKGYVLNNERININNDNYNNFIKDVDNIKTLSIDNKIRLDKADKKFEKLEEKIASLSDKDNIFKGMILYENEYFKAYSFVKDLMLSAKKELIIMDDYINYSVLNMCDDLKKEVLIKIYTLPSSKLTSKDFGVFSKNHNTYLCKTNKTHYRLLIVDNIIYFFSHSFKDLGEKRSCVIKCDFINKDEFLNGIEK